MQRPLVGLLVGMCLLLFTSPLIAADAPKALAGMEMSTLQELDDDQLGQIYGTGPFNNGWDSYVTERLALSLTQIIPRWLEGVGPFSPPPDIPVYPGLLTQIIPRWLDRFGPDDPWERPAFPGLP